MDRVSTCDQTQHCLISWQFGGVGANMESMNTPTTPDMKWAQAKVDALIKRMYLTLSQRFLLMARCAK